LKLKGTPQLLVHAGNVHILDASVYIIQKHPEALIVASKEFVLEVSAENMKYVIMSQNQHAVQNHKIK
jgi:hypothetical protein